MPPQELDLNVSEIIARVSLEIDRKRPSENRKATALQLLRAAIELDQSASTLSHPFTYEILDGGELEGKKRAGVLFAGVIIRQRDCLIECAITEWNHAKILRENEQREDRIRAENTSVGS